MEKLQEAIIDAVIAETIHTIPDELYNFYANLPGRKPSELSKSISNSIQRMDKGEAISIIRAAVDSSIFRMLYLLESEFKDLNVKSTFYRDGDLNFNSSDGLVEFYRSKIGPGGDDV